MRQVPVHSPKFMSSVGLRKLERLAYRRRAHDNASNFENGALANTAIVSEPETDAVREVQRRRYKKFLVVRHPLDRVVSAYRDKFVRQNRYSKYFHRKYGRLIVSRYRNKLQSQSTATRESQTPPPKLATDAAAAARDAISDDLRPSVDYANNSSGHDVKFTEFVNFLIDESPEIETVRTNPHWDPVARMCQPCNVRYNYVVRLENFQREIEAVWNELYPRSTPLLRNASQSVLGIRRNSGPDDDYRDDDDWSKGGPSVDAKSVEDLSSLDGGTTSVTSRYLRLLTDSELCKLANVYRDDLELFGYRLNTDCDEFFTR